MTANALLIYGKNKDDIRLNDLVSSNLRMALLTSSYIPNVSVTGHSLYSDLSGELPTVTNGYTIGGAALTGVVDARSISGVAQVDGYKLSSNNAAWTPTVSASIPAFRFAVLYYLGTLWGLVNPLIGYILCDNTPADIPITTTENTLTIVCPQDGWFDVV